MYYDTLEEALAAAPDCTHVLTTGPDWNRSNSPFTFIGKFVPVVKQDDVFFHAEKRDEEYLVPEGGWVIVYYAKSPSAQQQVIAARFDLATPEHDPVNSPSHYLLLPGVEVYDVRHAILAKHPDLAPSIVDDWSRSWEYLTRMFGKNELEDAKKARWYLDKLIARLEDQ